MIKTIAKSDCCGCLACCNICPNGSMTMKADTEGFLYPEVDMTNCLNCNLCEKACPIFKPKPNNDWTISYAAQNKDKQQRMNSSSGGIFRLLAEEVISQNGVVFGAKFADDFSVIHDYTDSLDGIAKFQGSKYVQSNIGRSYSIAKGFLEAGRITLFTGTPCQIAGLHSYLGKYYENLLTQDIICHGVPSPKVWKAYLDYHRKKAGAEITEIAFRNKKTGWHEFQLVFTFDDGKKYEQKFYNDPYMNGFLCNTFLRPSCSKCHFKTIHRYSDLTLADFWGVEKIAPDMDDNQGTSLVMLHTSKGVSFFKAIEKRIAYKVVELDQALLYNAPAYKSSVPNSCRDVFFRDLDDTIFSLVLKTYCNIPVSVKVKRLIRRQLSNIRIMKT